MKISQKITIPLAAFALIGAGAASMVAYQSHAQTPSQTTAQNSAQISDNDSANQQQDQQQDQQQRQNHQRGPGSFDPKMGGHIGKNGVKEELLTGDSATKATAAAQAAVQGGTIERVENDADGEGTYEAHMTKPDGSHVTVLMDENYNVTNTKTGPGDHYRGQ